ncbi:hypothetical protein J2Z83_002499 [Virgibacillus natechei]|uniref:Uncharacterized protein n=1 Tax=Virgibacillus natechei TaxID=1216297 RepID=A0ABS4IHH2_9BACI|nr:hypothetical protein [Virgibacillus natechei]
MAVFANPYRHRIILKRAITVFIQKFAEMGCVVQKKWILRNFPLLCIVAFKPSELM